MKVSELTGPMLDYWTGKADGKKVRIIPEGSYPYDDKETEIFFHRVSDGYIYPGTIGLHYQDTLPEYSPSTDWSQGGPIIEREDIAFSYKTNTGYARAHIVHRDQVKSITHYGDTKLIAAMRCYVASKFGEEVDEQT